MGSAVEATPVIVSVQMFEPSGTDKTNTTHTSFEPGLGLTPANGNMNAFGEDVLLAAGSKTVLPFARPEADDWNAGVGSAVVAKASTKPRIVNEKQGNLKLHVGGPTCAGNIVWPRLGSVFLVCCEVSVSEWPRREFGEK